MDVDWDNCGTCAGVFAAVLGGDSGVLLQEEGLGQGG